MKCLNRLLAPAINLDYVEAPWLQTTTLWLALNTANPEDFEALELVVADWRNQIMRADNGWFTLLTAFGGTAEVVAARRGPTCNALIALNFAGVDSKRIAQATDLAVQLLLGTPFASPKSNFPAVLAQVQKQLAQVRNQPQSQALIQCQALLRAKPSQPTMEWERTTLQERWEQIRRSCAIHALIASPLASSEIIDPIAAALLPLSTPERTEMAPMLPKAIRAEFQNQTITAAIPEHVVLGLHSSITMADQRFPALRAALGVWATNPNSHILRELRGRRELVYRIQANLDLWTGDVLLTLPIEATEHGQAITLVLDELHRLRAGHLTDAEVVQTRHALLRDTILQWEHSRRLLDHVLSLRIAGGNPSDYDYLSAIRTLDASAIITASAHLQPAACVFVRNQ